MQGVCASVLATLLVVLVLLHWDTGAHRLASVKRRAIAAKVFRRRPLGQDGDRRRRVWSEFLARMNNFPANDREDRFDAFDLLFRHCEVVV